MDSKNIIKIYTTSSGAELNISTPDIKQTISATNNRAQYFAEQAKIFRDEAKIHMENAKLYADQNSDVTFEYIDQVKTSLQKEISTKQDTGNYALKEELPINISELNNDAEYVNKNELSTAISEVELPAQEGCDGKVLMTDGHQEKWVGINTFQLFDTKITDYVLSFTEAIGWELQGTYVYKEALLGTRHGYPDFYNKCIEEKEASTPTEISLNDLTITIYTHSNGHKFYNIADKNFIDSWLEKYGSAWFYGIDTENECIFLPRNNYFEQVTGDITKVGESIKAGLPNIEGVFGGVPEALYNQHTGAFYPLTTTGPYSGVGSGSRLQSAFDASKSNSIYGCSQTVQPNAVKKLLYICVGNTTNYEGITSVINQGKEILEQVNQSIASRIKLDGSNAQFPYITETYINDKSGLIIYSNGYCEQWGYQTRTSGSAETVTLLKPYNSTNYNIQLTNDSNYTSAYAPLVVKNKQTITNFSILQSQGPSYIQGVFWRTSGYIN